MVMAFFDMQGLIYSHIIPKGTSINAAYTIKVPGKSFSAFQEEEAHHGRAAVMVSLGQSAGAHSEGLDSSKKSPGD
jgi:hypothetical protein